MKKSFVLTKGGGSGAGDPVAPHNFGMEVNGIRAAFLCVEELRELFDIGDAFILEVIVSDKPINAQSLAVYFDCGVILREKTDTYPKGEVLATYEALDCLMRREKLTDKNLYATVYIWE